MPLAKYYGGKGASVMKQMKSEYGAKKGERVFYATANKMKKMDAGMMKMHTSKRMKEHDESMGVKPMKMAKPCKSCMGRKVEYNSPAKHPEQSDPYAAMDLMTEKATQAQPGTMEQMRKTMKPLQRESPKPAQGLMDYIKRLGGK